MYYIPMGMVNGADVSVGKYLGQSLIPSLIGNSKLFRHLQLEYHH